MITLALGIIIGLLLNPMKQKVADKDWQLRILDKIMPQGKTTFIESKSFDEKFNEAKDIGDITNG